MIKVFCYDSERAIAPMGIVAMMSCDQHDYIEIACLYHMNIVWQLHNGQVFTGRAQDTLYNAQKKECVAVLLDDSLAADRSPIHIELLQLASMRAVEANPHLDVVTFS